MIYPEISWPRLAVGSEFRFGGVGVSPSHEKLFSYRQVWYVHPNKRFALSIPFGDFVLALNSCTGLEAKVDAVFLELTVAKASVE